MAQQILEKLDFIAEKTLLNRVDKHPSLQFVEKKIHVKPSAIILIILAVLIPVLLFLAPSGLVLAIVAYAIPAVMTFRAMQSKDKEKHIKYLIYWAIFAACEIVSPIGNWITGPFIWLLIRLAIIGALLHPKVDGSLIIYRSLRQGQPETTTTEATPKKSGEDMLLEEPKKTV